MGLTNNQQALLVFIAFALPSIGTWASLGFPTDRLALGALVAALIAGVILAIKEAWGVAIPTSSTTLPAAPAATPKANATPAAIFRIKHRLMFLELRK
jgi:hypothetical protein